jgi:signal transduction histidine kinase
MNINDNIVDTLKIEERQVKVDNKPFSLNALMEEIFSKFMDHPVYKQKNAERHNIILKFNKPDKNLTFTGDSGHIKQIFVNLIDNALKFTEKGYIYYGFTVKNGEIVFYVMDSGIGIPADKKDTIFNRFAQEDNA